MNLRLNVSLALIGLAIIATVIRAQERPIQDVWTDVSRIVAVGDVHGDFEQFVSVLRAARVIDDRRRWTGGTTHLVQTGDVLDRGPDSRKTLDLLMTLEEQAERAGGRVHALIGNHEAMNVFGDLRYVSAGEYAAFRDRNSEAMRDAFFRRYVEILGGPPPPPPDAPADSELRRKFNAEYPLGYVEHRIAYGPKGRYGRWLRQKNAIVKIDDSLFVHGGMSQKFTGSSIARLNDDVRTEIEELSQAGPPMQLDLRVSTDPNGPLWYRDLVSGDEQAFASHVGTILETYGVRRVVVGHTVNEGAIIPRFDGRVLSIDVGLSAIYGGPAASVVIEEGKVYAIHRGTRLEVPASSGPARVEYLAKAASLDPPGSRLRKYVETLKAAAAVPATVP